VESGESVSKKVPTSSDGDLSLAGKGCVGLKVSLAKTWKMLPRRATILPVRLWRTFGWWAIVFMPILLIAVSYSIEQLLLNLQDVQRYEAVVAMMAISAVPVIVASRKFQRPVRTKPHNKVLKPLIASAEEYCLLLRPFGSDGEIILPHKWDPWWVPRALRSLTLEQTVALITHESIGLKMYALVDQDRLLAPPGPVYLRSPHDQWQSVTRMLIRRARPIVIILSPEQGIRKSFRWEIEQIVQYDLQSRVIIVLPPHDRYSNVYNQALQQACLLVATLENFTGSVQDVDP
jgi:hypothetical protein